MQKGRQLDSQLNPLENCIDEPYVHQTFSYFADIPSWYSLYNTYEMIKFDVDGNMKEYGFDEEKCKKVCRIVRDSWASTDELKKFKRAANDPHSEGNPRHSPASYLNKKKQKRERKNLPASVEAFIEAQKEKRRKKHPESSQLISLSEANTLMTRVFRSWCKWKARQCEVKTRLLFGALAGRLIYDRPLSYSHSGK